MNAAYQQTTLLLVDDEQSVLDELTKVLSAAGYECQGCTSPEAALDLVRAGVPDLIISDINLAGHSGLEMCERIREEMAIDDIPVMFLSGAQIPDIIRRSHAAGGTYYLRKPFDPEVLVELVHKALFMPHLVAAHAEG
jgi:CheY-like chemotaxis protein